MSYGSQTYGSATGESESLTGGLIPPAAATANVLLERVGRDATFYSASEPAENKYGRQSDTDVTYTKEAVAPAYRVYDSGNDRANEASVLGGNVDIDSPVIAFPLDISASEGWKLQFPDGKEYVLDEQVADRTHHEFRATLVT